jgi:hypothetical protein
VSLVLAEPQQAPVPALAAQAPVPARALAAVVTAVVAAAAAWLAENPAAVEDGVAPVPAEVRA